MSKKRLWLRYWLMAWISIIEGIIVLCTFCIYRPPLTFWFCCWELEQEHKDDEI